MPWRQDDFLRGRTHVALPHGNLFRAVCSVIDIPIILIFKSKIPSIMLFSCGFISIRNQLNKSSTS